MSPYRCKAEAAVTVRSPNVAQGKTAMEKAGALIAEATLNARKAAEQFAIDPGSRLGTIRTARQGLFEIHDIDQNSKNIKYIRVITPR